MTEDKFRKIYYQYYRLVKKMINDILHDDGFSEDVCQEVFMLFLEKSNTLDEKFYRYWFILNARRRAIDFCRKAYQVHEITIGAVSEETETPEEATDRIHAGHEEKIYFDEDVVNKIVLRELTGKMFEDLAKKNPDWYEIMIRMYVKGEEPEEIARALGISVENLRTKKHRIKNWLLKNYGGELEGA